MIFFLHILPQWLVVTGLALFMGVVSSKLWILPEIVGVERPDQEKVQRRLRRMLGISVAAMLLGCITGLFVRVAEMSGDPILSVLPLLPAVVLKTHFGRTWMIGASSIVLMFLFAAGGAARSDSRTVWSFLFALGAIVGMTQSASGHAADAGDFSAAEIADWLHLMAGMLWAGGLFALAFAVLPRTAAGFPGAARTTSVALARFSNIAGPAAALIAVTSVYNAYVDIGGIAELVRTDYGLTASVKILLFLIVLTIAAFNRFIGIPWLKSGETPVPERKKPSGPVTPIRIRLHRIVDRNPRLLNAAIKAEVLFLLALLLCAVMMRHEIPAKHAGYLDTPGGHVHEHK